MRVIGSDLVVNFLTCCVEPVNMAVELPEGITKEFFDFLMAVDAPEQRAPEHIIKIAQAFKAGIGRVIVCWAVRCDRLCEANDVSCALSLIGVDFSECTTSKCSFAAPSRSPCAFTCAYLPPLQVAWACRVDSKASCAVRSARPMKSTIYQDVVGAILVAPLTPCRMVTAVGNASAQAPAEKSDAGSVRALIDVIKKDEVTICVDLDTKIRVCLHVWTWDRLSAHLSFTGDVAGEPPRVMLSTN